MRNAVIVEACRTPIGKKDGWLRGMRADYLRAIVLEALGHRSVVEPAKVDDVMVGCVTQIGEQGVNIARNALLAAGFPASVPGTSINRLCGSSQQAANFAAQSVMAGAN